MKPALRILLSLCVAWSTCQAQSYFKVIGQVGRSEAGYAVHQAPTGELYIGGSVNDSAMVQRIEGDGNVLWSRRFRTASVSGNNVVHLSSALDGSLIGCGVGYDGNGEPIEGFHFRIGADGTVYWVRSWDDPQVHGRRMIAISATEYLLFGGYTDLGTANYTDVLTARIDAATGDVNWMSGRLDLYAPVPYIGDMVSVATIGDRHYAACSIFTNGAPLSTRRVALSTFDQTGQHIDSKYLLYPNTDSRRLVTSDIIAVNDSLTMSYFGDINGASTNFSQGLIRMDTLGNIAWARDFNVGGSNMEQNTRVVAAPFGYVIAGRTMNTTPVRLFLMAISHSGDHLWTKTYGPTTQTQTLTSLYASNVVALPDGFLLTGAVDQGGDLDLLLIRTDINGDIQCSDVTPRSALTTILPELNFPSPVLETPFTANLTGDPVVAVDALISNLCVLDVNLGNDTSLCGTVQLDPGPIQDATYEWSDGSTGQTLDVDSSGTYWVRVTVDCCVASDTVEVAVGSLPDLDLGNDTTMCIGLFAVFTAPDGPWSIDWSDGSVGPEFYAFEPGTYWVTLTDGGCTASDTVVVSGMDLPTVSFGLDTLSCDGSPVLLDPATTEVAEYLWSDASTDSTYLASSTEQVWVRVSNACGNASDTANVVVINAPELDLGPDTLVCAGGTLLVDVDLPGWTLAWSDGSATEPFSITAGGTYWLEATNAGCILNDSITVADLAVPVVSLGNDTVVCNGAGLLLAPVLTDVDAQLWSDGSTATTLQVITSGTYTIEASNVCGTGSDAVNVSIVAPLQVQLGPDTLLCGTDSLLLDLSTSGVQITWQDTVDAATYLVTAPGSYWVEGNELGCILRDTLVVAYTDLAVLDLGPDTVLCTVPILVLDAGEEGDPAVWQDNSEGRYHEATRTGWYVASITNYCGTVTDSVRLSFSIPEVPMEDIDLCPGEKVELDPQGEMLTTIWTTGDTARTITVGEGAYGYWAEDIYGCEHADQVFVRITPELDGIVYVPNSFTPDKDGINETFHVVGAEDGDFEMVLFDRWGLEVYRTVDPFKGWDGTLGGGPVPPDVYVYTVTYEDRCNANNTLVTTRGHVTLLR